LLQLVAVVHALVERIESYSLGGYAVGSAAGRFKDMVWVKLLAKLDAAGARGEESSVAVLRQGPQPETTRASPKRRLRPLVVVRVQTGKLLEAGPDLIIEAGDSSRVEARRDSTDGENHFAESRAAAQQVESDLGVGQLAESLQELAGLADPFLSMRVAELRGADRTAEKLEVAVSHDLEVRGKSASINRGGMAGSEDELALVLEVGRASAELQAQGSTAGLKDVDGPADSRGLASQTKVVEVSESEFKAPCSAEVSQLGENRVED
jgi:hypothetical protein